MGNRVSGLGEPFVIILLRKNKSEETRFCGVVEGSFSGSRLAYGTDSRHIRGIVGVRCKIRKTAEQIPKNAAVGLKRVKNSRRICSWVCKQQMQIINSVVLALTIKVPTHEKNLVL